MLSTPLLRSLFAYYTVIKKTLSRPPHVVYISASELETERLRTESYWLCTRYIEILSCWYQNCVLPILLTVVKGLFITQVYALKSVAWLCWQKFPQEFRFKTHLFLQNVLQSYTSIYFVTCLRNVAIRFVVVAAFIIMLLSSSVIHLVRLGTAIWEHILASL
jgi:hypothetical protein